MKLQALFLNCTLKKTPTFSNTEAFIGVASDILNDLDVSSRVIRVADYNIAFGTTSSKKEEDDEWPEILEAIKKCDILVIATPLWRGDRSAIAKMVAERMDGIMSEDTKPNGQYFSYNKVGGALANGNEDGAKHAIHGILTDLSEQGFTVPVNAFSYYVGKAGPGKSYIKAKGYRHEFTNNMLLVMCHNLVHLAAGLKTNPYRTPINKLKEKAQKMSE